MLGQVLIDCYGAEPGDLRHLDEAIAAHEQAVHAAPGGRQGLVAVCALAEALRMRCDVTGDIADLERALTLSGDATVQWPAGAGLPVAPLTVLSLDLTDRFMRYGHIMDIEEAITAYRLMASEPDAHAESLRHLSNALNARFQVTGQPASRTASTRWSGPR